MGKHYHGRGRKEKLTKAQQKQLHDMVAQGPEAHGFSSGIWNCAMIAELILLKFSVCYNLNYLPSLLKKLGLSYQKAHFISDRYFFIPIPRTKSSLFKNQKKLDFGAALLF